LSAAEIFVKVNILIFKLIFEEDDDEEEKDKIGSKLFLSSNDKILVVTSQW